MKSNKNEILINMPDCSNRLFYFIENKITKCKKVSFMKSKNAVLYYNLNAEIQHKISLFLNPDAIHQNLKYIKLNIESRKIKRS